MEVLYQLSYPGVNGLLIWIAVCQVAAVSGRPWRLHSIDPHFGTLGRHELKDQLGRLPSSG